MTVTLDLQEDVQVDAQTEDGGVHLNTSKILIFKNFWSSFGKQFSDRFQRFDKKNRVVISYSLNIWISGILLIKKCPKIVHRASHMFIIKKLQKYRIGFSISRIDFRQKIIAVMWPFPFQIEN